MTFITVWRVREIQAIPADDNEMVMTGTKMRGSSFDEARSSVDKGTGGVGELWEVCIDEERDDGCHADCRNCRSRRLS